MSILYKLLLAFGLVILFAAGLSAYSMLAITNTSDLVVSMYDGPLMGINHARSAHAKLTKATGLVQRAIQLREFASTKTAKEIDDEVASALADLKIVRERVTGDAVVKAIGQVEAAARAWSQAAASILKTRQGGTTEIPVPTEVAKLGDVLLAA